MPCERHQQRFNAAEHVAGVNVQNSHQAALKTWS
jgi:hypothetical protein